MTGWVYVDSSVLLRVLLRQPNALRTWRRIERAMASALVETECLHTLDRLRLAASLSDEDVSVRREAAFRLLKSMALVEPTWTVLRRAAQPMPTALGTLDAVHLATALLWREQRDEHLTLATHDAALATAARAHGFPVIGSP